MFRLRSSPSPSEYIFLLFRNQHEISYFIIRHMEDDTLGGLENWKIWSPLILDKENIPQQEVVQRSQRKMENLKVLRKMK